MPSFVVSCVKRWRQLTTSGLLALEATSAARELLLILLIWHKDIHDDHQDWTQLPAA